MTSQLDSAQEGAQNARRRENVEAILPLLPLQKAMLLHMDVRDPSAGFLQVRATLDGRLDVLAFREAWEAVMALHPALRMSVHSIEGKDPMAVLWRSVSLPWQVHDLDGKPRGNDFLDELLMADRKAGLDPSRAPTSRINLVRTSPDRHELVWTTHHLFLDGWSTAIVLEDVMSMYTDLTHGAGASPSPSRADLLRSLHASSVGPPTPDALEYWRARFAGFEGLPALRTSLGDDSADRYSAVLDETVTESLDELARRYRLTANSLAQAAWAVALAHFFGSNDVAFGTTVAGRSSDIGDVGRLVGYLANVVPVRVKVDPEEGLESWLRSLRDEQFESQRYERVPLSEIHNAIDLAGGKPLFETFLVFENFPAEMGADGPVKLSGFKSDLTSSYPLTVAIIPGPVWVIHSRFDRQRIDKPTVTALIEDLKNVLSAMATGPTGSVSDLLGIPGLTGSNSRLVEEISQAPASAVPPANETEERMLGIWVDLLGTPGIGVNDDYFDSGGTSVMALELFARIEEEFEMRLPINTLIRSSTVAQLAAEIGADDIKRPTRFRSLVPFRAEGSKPPIVCIHAGGAHVLFYRELADQFDQDQPVYGMEPLGLDGLEEPLESIPEMAALYISELLTVQPNGPYRLLGYCLGATIGLEMSRQLEEAGHEVDLLVVLDTGPPGTPDGMEQPAVKIRRHYESAGIPGVVKFLARKLYVRGRRLARKLARDESGRQKTAQELVQRASQRAAFKYHAEPVEAPILLVRSSQFAGRDRKRFHLEWANLTSRMDVDVIEGIHARLLFTPEVQRVADAIKAKLEG